MRVCVSCSTLGSDLLCRGCRRSLSKVGPTHVGGLDITGGLLHKSVARHLVHLLKYRGVVAAGAVLGAIMATQMPVDVSALVPVPRAWLRRTKYGVDPALVLARTISAHTGVDVVAVLSPTLWWPSHAGADRAARNTPYFRCARPSPPGSVLIDDVMTTGATLLAASRITGITRASTATRADSRCNE